MALPESGPISASMIRTELNIPSQVPFSLSEVELAGYADLNALSISSSVSKIADVPNISTPDSMSEWRGYNHIFTQSVTQPSASGLRVPVGSNYTTFAQFDVGTTSAVITFTGSNFVISGTAPAAEIPYTIYYSTYVNISNSKFIRTGSMTPAAPSSSFTYIYNASSGSVVTFLFRRIPVPSRAWSTSNVLNTARGNLSGAGTQNEALAFGGISNTSLSCTEEYNGTSWTASNVLACARYALGGAGTQNAGLAFGGVAVSTIGLSCTEEYNGTSWAGGGNLNVGRFHLRGAGEQNAALAVGGDQNNTPSGNKKSTEEYNGTSWAGGGNLIVGRDVGAAAGTQNAAIYVGGFPTTIFGYTNCTETYNGTSWTAGCALITSRGYMAIAGTQNESIVYGGQTNSGGGAAYSEEFNGTSWIAAPRIINNRAYLAGAGIQTAALAFGGLTPTAVACTEEYS